MSNRLSARGVVPGPKIGAPGIGSLWGVVLAGGGGVRLRALAQRICGDDRPKQYVPVLGDRTLLRQTLDRVALGIPSARTAVVTLRSHAPYFTEQWAGPELPAVLVQPADRGTAAGIVFPLHWIGRRDPAATVAVFPSDHFVSESAMFMAHIAQVASWVDEHPDRLVLLGAHATGPEVEYGWIEPGRPLDSTDDRRIWEVRCFWEKPSEERRRASVWKPAASGTPSPSWAKVSTFLRASREAVPEVDERLERAEAFFGTDEEAWALHQAYALMPKANFSREILESCPAFLVVAAIRRIVWSDLGTPRRVFEVLESARDRPAWMLASNRAAS